MLEPTAVSVIGEPGVQEPVGPEMMTPGVGLTVTLTGAAAPVQPLPEVTVTL